MIRILKWSGLYFSGKRLCDGYRIDIVWSLCVEVNIQQKVAWFYEKASLKAHSQICDNFLQLKAL